MFSRIPRLARLSATALAATMVVVSTAFPSPAAGGAAALQQSRSKIADIRKRLAAFQGQATQIESEVKKLDAQIADLDKQITTGQHDISLLESDFRTVQAQIGDLESKFQKAAQASNQRARRLYVQGPAKAIAMLFSTDSVVEFSRLQFWMEKSSEQDSKVIVDTSRLKADLVEKQNQINKIRSSLGEQRRWLQDRKKLADAARADRAAALKSVEKQIQAQKDEIAATEAESARIEAELRNAASRSQESGAGAQASRRPGGNTTGTGEGGAASGSGFLRPTGGPVTSPYGPRWGKFHSGLDIDGNTGDPVRAAQSGTISSVSCGGGFGICTIIDHGGGVSTLYAHMSGKAVTSGPVQRGQVIGYVGNTGVSTGSHLHWEVRVNGTPQNPNNFLK